MPNDITLQDLRPLNHQNEIEPTEAVGKTIIDVDDAYSELTILFEDETFIQQRKAT